MILVSTAICVASALAQQQPAPPQQANPVAVQKPKPPKSKLKRVHVDLSGFELDKSDASASTTQIGGGTRGIDGLTTLLAPRFSRVYTAHPVFQWSHTSQAQNFEFSLFDEKQNLLYKAHVSGREFRYPDSAPPLQPGVVYSWNVKPGAALLGGVSLTYHFSRLSQTEIDDISQQLERIGMDGISQSELRAQLFTERRLWFDTIQTLSDLIKAHPEDPELFERRGIIYDQIRVTNALAEEDFAVADQLRDSQNP